MINDVTDTWRKPRATGGGIYVLRGSVEDYHEIVRVGVAGVRKSKTGIYGRLNRHTKRWSGKLTLGTHECQPFDLIRAWELPDWTTDELASAEHCLYRAFAVRFRRRMTGLPDHSLFVVPPAAAQALAGALTQVGSDLRAIDVLRLTASRSPMRLIC
ncbi:hypothetical protein FHS96_002597 [Sphingomonas zeicaulis]|uniref:hypothetical protein n=1 Tax=Sphingomonas zeicaulis TaxID=1632740 RepID=UPI003D1C4684